jgi:hypothetical protein
MFLTIVSCFVSQICANNTKYHAKNEEITRKLRRNYKQQGKKKARSGVLRALGVRGLKVLSALTRAKDSVDTALLFLCLALCVVEQLMERLKFVVYACEVDLLILILCIFHCSKILKVKQIRF